MEIIHLFYGAINIFHRKLYHPYPTILPASKEAENPSKFILFCVKFTPKLSPEY